MFLWEILQAEVIIINEEVKKLRQREVRVLAPGHRVSQGPGCLPESQAPRSEGRRGEASGAKCPCREQGGLWLVLQWAEPWMHRPRGQAL